jgi:hypothetical protein
MRLSRFLTMAASSLTLRAARLPRPFFIFARTPSAGLRSGGLTPCPPAPPPLTDRLRADPQAPGHLYRPDFLPEHPRGLQPHHFTPGQPPIGQTTTIRIPHDPGIDRPPVKITPTRRP